MKNLFNGAICLLLLCNSISIYAQKKLPVREPDTNRPSLFKDFPSRINCHINNLESLLDSPIGKKVSIRITDEILFQGIISSVSSQENNSLKSIVIKSGNIEGASLTFSKIIREDGSFYFSGRIISFRHGDGYEIINEKGEYSFVKKKFYDMVSE